MSKLLLPVLLLALVFAGCKKEDVTRPVITVIGANPAEVDLGDTYTDQGASAEDDVDGDISNSIIVSENVNENTAGTYTVTYSVSDAAGNTATATRTVNVNISRDAVLGGYHTTNNCPAFPYNTVSTIPQFQAGSTEDKIVINPFYYNGGTLIVTISGTTVTVDPGQSPNPIMDGVTGSGTFNSTGTVLVMDYTFQPNGGSPTSCSVTYTHD